MLVDWFTVGAQVLNFLVLVWLLKRFLYKPLLEAIDARENRIAGEMAAAEALRVEAEQERETWERKNREIDATREELLDAAREEARLERQQQLEQARRDAEAARAKYRQGLLHEQEGLHAELARQTSNTVFEISRKALSDLADARLDEAISLALVNRLGTMPPEEREALALSTTTDHLRVRSAFTLEAQSQEKIREALSRHLGSSVQIDFSVEPDLIAGIEILTTGQRLAWNIDAYLAAMQRSVDATLTNASALVEMAEPEPAEKEQA